MDDKTASIRTIRQYVHQDLFTMLKIPKKFHPENVQNKSGHRTARSTIRSLVSVICKYKGGALFCLIDTLSLLMCLKFQVNTFESYENMKNLNILLNIFTKSEKGG